MNQCISSADEYKASINYLLNMDPYSRPFLATGLKDEGVGRKGRLG